MTIIKGPQITLRPWQKTDDLALVKYANNPKVSAWLIDSFPYPYSLDDAHWWLSNHPTINFAIDHRAEAIGGIGITLKEDIYRKTAQLGYWLAEPFWGKGIMTEAVSLMVKYVFANYDIERIQAGIFDANPGSMKVLERAGFTKEGICKKALCKKGIMYDEHLYALVKP